MGGGWVSWQVKKNEKIVGVEGVVVRKWELKELCSEVQ